jgi:hypothetical protein
MRPDLHAYFDRDALRRVCLTHETKIGDAYDMTRTEIDQPGPENYYYYKDHGSNILAVAHLDTVVADDKRRVTYHDTEDGLVIQSGCLDDRLGAYIILELLPAVGLQFDILLTVGEESGMSTAGGFVVPEGKEYDWIIEFDRGGMDVVTYDYEDAELVDRIESVGAVHAPGIFSDISYMEHVGVKAMNWGVAYHDYHGPNGYAYIDETLTMVDLFLDFHALYGQVNMPHTQRPYNWRWSRSRDLDSLMDSWIGGGYVASRDDEDMWVDESIDLMWDEDGRPIYLDDDGPECYDDDGFYIGPPSRQRPIVDLDDVIDYPTPEQLRAASMWPD